MANEATKRIYALMAHAEEQQASLDNILKAMEQQQAHLTYIQENVPDLFVKVFQQSLNDARTSIEKDLNKQASSVARDIRSSSIQAQEAAQAIRRESKYLGWKHAFFVVGSISAACFLLILATLFFIPSLDDIAKRKTTVESLDNAGGEIQTATCEGKLCVRVMTKQCGFGNTKDYCVVDLIE